MTENPFVLPWTEYKRDINVIRDYIDDQARYLSIETNQPYEVCAEFVKESLRPGGQFEFKDPRMLYTERGENGDRSLKQGTLSQYLHEAVHMERLIAPSLTTYLNPEQCPSLLVNFIDDNVKGRSVAKKAMFAARREGNEVMDKIYDNEQNNRKLSNNSISGAHLSAGQPLYNKTAHITLTSNCRSTSGFGNANNEKLLSGNRHYWSVQITLNNIVSIVNHTDYDQLGAACAEYGIKYPTYEQTMECIRYSTNLYWADRGSMAKVESLVSKLTPIQRAAFVYTGDLYHLMRFNEPLVREFITRMAYKPTEPHPDPEAVIKSAPEDVIFTAVQICEEHFRGIGPDGKNIDWKKLVGTREYGILGATVANIQSTLAVYFNMIRALWVTPNVPASLAWFPDSIRRAALTSDTDSTIFTVQDWIEWYFGEIKVDAQSNGVAAVFIYFSAATIVHILARMSANFGIKGEKRLFQIAMKNEYKFDVFVPTQVAKHYFALIGCQEGDLYAKYKKEIKGVHLKSSNAPIEITKAAEDLMLDIMNKVLKGQKISLTKILTDLANREREIMASIERGDSRVFRKGQIKPPESYTKDKDESPYIQYEMWQEVFAPDYGDIPPPPYVCVRIATSVDTPSKTKEWLEGLSNQAFANRMRNWMVRNNKKYVGSIQLPEQVISSKGVPKEILQIAGVRQIVRDTTGVFYLILEALGFFMLDDKNSRLALDLY